MWAPYSNLKFLKVGLVFTITKKWSHIIIPIKVGPHCKSYECEPHILILKGGYHAVISKSGFCVHKNKKGGPTLKFLNKGESHGRNYKRWAHIVNLINVGHMF